MEELSLFLSAFCKWAHRSPNVEPIRLKSRRHTFLSWLAWSVCSFQEDATSPAGRSLVAHFIIEDHPSLA
jgi:hypothetical protein